MKSEVDSMKQTILLREDSFSRLRQKITLYKKDNLYTILIQDMDLKASTPIHAITPRDYKRLCKIYKRLDYKISIFGKTNFLKTTYPAKALGPQRPSHNSEEK